MDAKDSPCLHAHNHISNQQPLFCCSVIFAQGSIFENGIANEATFSDLKIVKK